MYTCLVLPVNSLQNVSKKCNNFSILYTFSPSSTVLESIYKKVWARVIKGAKLLTVCANFLCVCIKYIRVKSLEMFKEQKLTGYYTALINGASINSCCAKLIIIDVPFANNIFLCLLQQDLI